MLGSVQKDLHKLHIQANKIQVGIRKVSGVQVVLTQGSGTVVELEHSLDLKFIPLPEGSVRIESDKDHVVISTVKEMGWNLAMFPLQILHALHQGVSYELKL